MKLDYVDIFYHHRPDPETPLEETMGALADMVRPVSYTHLKQMRSRLPAVLFSVIGKCVL